jgi:hypothetical protein
MKKSTYFICIFLLSFLCTLYLRLMNYCMIPLLYLFIMFYFQSYKTMLRIFLFYNIKVSQICVTRLLVFLRAAVIEANISDYLPQAWKGAFVVSFLWFLHWWKTNFISNSVSKRTDIGIDRERLSGFDKVSSLGLIALGIIALAEAFGVPVQSILTVGGVGGKVLAF